MDDSKRPVITKIPTRGGDNLLTASARHLGEMGRLASQQEILEDLFQASPSDDTFEHLLRSAQNNHDYALATRLMSSRDTGPQVPSLSLPKTTPLKPLRFFDNPKPRVVGICDEFTQRAISAECLYMPLHPAKATRQVDEFQPNFLFVESAWRGSAGTWAGLIKKTDPRLITLVQHCRKNNIPTVFWNKEDPIHFTAFLGSASLFDIVLTTDSSSIPKYKQKIGHSRVFLWRFGVQQREYNPIQNGTRDESFVFAGSYYGRYDERKRDTDRLISTAQKYAPVRIYDRNFGKNQEELSFPEKYQSLIVGSLSNSEVPTAYKKSTFGINLNTVKNSETMFARRVLELVASNNDVLSNASLALHSMFGNLVISSDDREELEAQLESRFKNDGERRKKRAAALRKVLLRHSYASRFASLSRHLSMDVDLPTLPSVAVACVAKNQDNATKIMQMYGRQQKRNGRLFLYSHEPIETNEHDITVIGNQEDFNARVQSDYRNFDFFGLLSQYDFYGANYLLDLRLATTYCNALGFGKSCYFAGNAEFPQLRNQKNRYIHTDSLFARSAIFSTSALSPGHILSALQRPESFQFSDRNMFSVDEFNYCRDSDDLEIAATTVEDIFVQNNSPSDKEDDSFELL